MFYSKIQKFFLSQYKSMLAFAIVGGTTFLFYIAIFTVFFKVFDTDYRIAVSLAYVIAVMFHFFSNRNWVFKANHCYLKHQLMKYGVVLVFGYFITLAVVYCVVDYFKLSAYFGIIIANAINMCSNYLLLKHWAFAVKI